MRSIPNVAHVSDTGRFAGDPDVEKNVWPRAARLGFLLFCSAAGWGGVAWVVALAI